METTNIREIPLIEKEDIATLKFPPTDVLKDYMSISQRVKVLHHATSLGNLDKHKVLIIFEDADGLKRVNTTIWAITEKRIVLKNNTTIPISRIHSVIIS